jgi:hypothetical protein
MTSHTGQNWFANPPEAGPVVLQDPSEELLPCMLEPTPIPIQSELDAHAVLREALRGCEGTRRTRRVNVSLRLLARNHYIVADANRLRLTLEQMVRRAIEIAPVGSQLTIRSSRPADCALRIEVEERSSYLKNHRPAEPEPPRQRSAASRRRQ